MPMDPTLLRSLSGEYDVVAKAAADTTAVSSLVATIQKARNPDAWGEEVTKAIVISVDGKDVVSAGNQRPSIESEQNFFLGAGALIPRYDPWAMARVWENSSALRPCIDAYCANIDSYGVRFDPVIDLDKETASKLVRSALVQQRIYEGSVDVVTDDHVAATMATMRLEMEREKFQLERFFAYCNPIMSFVELRMQTRLELESMGNAYWEVIRDGRGGIQQFERIDGVTVRLRPIHIEHVLVDTPQKTSPLHYTTIPVPRRFRTFVQLVNGLIAVYFKEFGDRRVLSAKTGNFYADRDELKDKEGQLAVEATEILWWSIFAPIGPYGVPRWVGATMNVLGLRASEEINFSYFDKKCIPPLAILVSGGALKAGAVDAIRTHLKETIQGRENFHAVLVIEAESSPGAQMGAASRVKVELRPLTEAQTKEALFQEYEKNGALKIGTQFRLPELLRGQSQEVNRAQAQAVLQFAEQQVFQPVREAFDHVMNRRILADMGIKYWVFKTNSAPASDPQMLATLTTQLATAGALTVNETRANAGEALNKEFKKIDEPWADAPYTLTLQGVMGLDGKAGAGKGGAPPGGAPPGGAPPEGEMPADGGLGTPPSGAAPPPPSPDEAAAGGAAPGATPPPPGAGAAPPPKAPKQPKPPQPGSPPQAGGAPAASGDELDAYFKRRRDMHVVPATDPSREDVVHVLVPVSKIREWIKVDGEE